MTSQQSHPITPNPEQIYLWQNDWRLSSYEPGITEIIYVATQAARWGSDQELEACLQWFSAFYCMETWMQKDLEKFRAARRPKPPSLKEQALGLLNEGPVSELLDHEVEIIRRALETLDD